MVAEKRRNTRVSFQTSVDLECGGKVFSGCESRDLSLKGVFLAGVGGVEPGSACELTIRLSGGSSDLSFRLKGEAVRVDADGVGIIFTEIDLDSFYHLRNIVYYNSGDPDRLAEEFISQIG